MIVNLYVYVIMIRNKVLVDKKLFYDAIVAHVSVTCAFHSIKKKVYQSL